MGPNFVTPKKYSILDLEQMEISFFWVSQYLGNLGYIKAYSKHRHIS